MSRRRPSSENPSGFRPNAAFLESAAQTQQQNEAVLGFGQTPVGPKGRSRTGTEVIATGAQFSQAELDRLMLQARRTNTLHLAGRELTGLPERLYMIHELDFGTNWWELGDLHNLNIRDNLLPSIPAKMSALTTLRTLDATRNKISIVPREFGFLTDLTAVLLGENLLIDLPITFAALTNISKLDLRMNQIQVLPDWIAELPLKEFYVCKNKLLTLPHSISEITTLQTLDVSNNSFSHLPVSVCVLPLLSLVELSNNKIATIPSEVATLNAVKRLDLRNNNIESLPRRLLWRGDKPWKSLNEMFLSYNRLTHFPPEWCAELIDLQTLDLSNNKLVSITPQISSMCSLKTLDLSNNDLSSLPGELGLVTTIARLIVDGNPLRSIRRDIIGQGTNSILKFLRTKLPQEAEEATRRSNSARPSSSASGELFYTLRDSAADGNLDLSNKKLISLPDEVFEVANLKKLILSTNSFTSLPDDIARLSALQVLYAPKNKLVGIPNTISYCAALTEIDLSANNITYLPNTMARLNGLKRLDFSQNPIGRNPVILDFLPALGDLIELRLGAVQLSSIPPQVISPNMKKLDILDLSGNQISAVPPEITRLGNLTLLDLKNNNISQMEPMVGLMTNLRALSLDGNPLRSIRHAVLQKGTPHVLAYLRDKIPQ